MYIRRKAYSVAYNENGEERLFSTTEICQKEFNSKAQKARRAEWDKKVAEDVWGSQTDEKTAKRIGRYSQKRNTASLDKKSGRARINRYENSKIQDLTGRKGGEISDAIKGERVLKSGPFDKIVDRSKRLGSRIISNTVDPVDVDKKLDKLVRADKVQINLIGRQHNLKNLEEKKNKKAKEHLKKNLEKGGKIALATGATLAAGYGAKKLYDKKKKDKKDRPQE